jgi:hypothetical protein
VPYLYRPDSTSGRGAGATRSGHPCHIGQWRYPIAELAMFPSPSTSSGRTASHSGKPAHLVRRHGPICARPIRFVIVEKASGHRHARRRRRHRRPRSRTDRFLEEGVRSADPDRLPGAHALFARSTIRGDHAAAGRELATTRPRASPAEDRARAAHPLGARIEAAVIGRMRIDALGGTAEGRRQREHPGKLGGHPHSVSLTLPSTASGSCRARDWRET